MSIILTFCLISTLSIKVEAQSVSHCDSILIELVNVQDSAINACEHSYFKLKKDFDLLNKSYQDQIDFFYSNMHSLNSEIIAIREELETEKAKTKKQFFIGAGIGVGIGVLTVLLIQ